MTDFTPIVLHLLAVLFHWLPVLSSIVAPFVVFAAAAYLVGGMIEVAHIWERRFVDPNPEHTCPECNCVFDAQGSIQPGLYETGVNWHFTPGDSQKKYLPDTLRA